MASNDEHVIPAGGDERRFLVLDMGDAQKQKPAYFAAIQNQLDNGGLEALLHHLMTLKLDGFVVQDVPRTAALHEQKLLSLGTEEEWWYQKLSEGCILFDGDGWPADVRKNALADDYVEYTRRFNMSRRGNLTALGRFLFKACGGRLGSVQKQTSWEEPTGDGWSRKVTGRAYFWKLPPLADVRKIWCKQFGEQEWEVIQEELPAPVASKKEGTPF